jgi:hypothetical protein
MRACIPWPLTRGHGLPERGVVAGATDKLKPVPGMLLERLLGHDEACQALRQEHARRERERCRLDAEADRVAMLLADLDVPTGDELQPERPVLLPFAEAAQEAQASAAGDRALLEDLNRAVGENPDLARVLVLRLRDAARGNGDA